MMIILLYILFMRMGTMALGIGTSSTIDTLVSTPMTSVGAEIHNSAFRSSNLEENIGSQVNVKTRNESLTSPSSVTETSSLELVPELKETVMPVSVGIAFTKVTEATEIREIASSSQTLKEEIMQLVTSPADTDSLSTLLLPVEMKTTSNNTSSSPLTNDSSHISEVSLKPTSPVKKASVVADLPKIRRKPSFSTVVTGKRCCEDQHNLDQNECVATTQLISFEPMLQIEMGSENDGYSFIWEATMLNCTEGFKLQEFNLDGDLVTIQANKTETFLQRKEFILTKTTNRYCIDQKVDGNYTALVCVPDIQELCYGTTCVKKCCASGEVMSHTSCKASPRELSPIFYTIHGEETPAPADYKIVSQVPQCPHITTLSFLKLHPYYLLSTGKLYINKTEKTLDVTQYCIDYYPEANDEIVMYCVDPPSRVQEWKVFLLPICMIISITFLLILVICHLLTHHLRNVQGLCFLAYSMSLLLSYIGFFANFKYTKQMNSAHCVFNGVFSQFSLHSAFFWLSVMCFDIWRVIRATVKCIPLTGILENDSQKFMLYSAYAFGCPVFIVTVTLIMHYLPPEYTNELIVPGFEKESCWFADNTSQFVYFYLVIALLNGISLAMLGHILFMLYQAEKGFSCFFQDKSTSRAFNRHHLELFRQRLCLFAVMAICWFTEVLSLKIPPKDMWVVTDLLNSLQGVIVFIIFISSKKKRQLVKSALVVSLSSVSNALTKSTSKSKDSQDSSTGNPENGKELVVLSSNVQTPPNKSNETLVEGKSNEEEAGGKTNKGFQLQDDVEGAMESNTAV